MLFHHLSFWIFFAGFVAAYVLARHNLCTRNMLVVAGSYFFYAWWDWRFLALIFASTLLDYTAGLGIAKSRTARGRRGWLVASLAGNLSILGFFKYWNFFHDSAVAILTAFGFHVNGSTLQVLLPVGISFYTFQTMSYTLDVHAGRIDPTRDFVAFAAYVAFFPQLVAGPIERARNLLPQFLTTRTITIDALRGGFDLIIFGLFKKVVIADQLAPFVDLVFGLEQVPTGLLALAVIAFGFQIYGDFSGYSDIARGVARTLGFELMVNFRQPYAAQSLRDFWRRWHISLSTWLRDYLYIPLGGSRSTKWLTTRNLFLTMALGGLWHGAAWHFVVWGCWHALGLVIERACSPTRGLGRLGTLAWVFVGWLFFRLPAVERLPALLNSGSAPYPAWTPDALAATFLLIAAQLALDRLQPDIGGTTASSRNRTAAASAIVLVITLACARADLPPFIYFQF